MGTGNQKPFNAVALITLLFLPPNPGVKPNVHIKINYERIKILLLKKI